MGGIPRVNGAAIGAVPIPPPELPGGGGRGGVLPSYAGFTFANGTEGDGPRIINIQPVSGPDAGAGPRVRLPGMPVDIPWGWN
jgi:hypothetical protein